METASRWQTSIIGGTTLQPVLSVSDYLADQDVVMSTLFSYWSSVGDHYRYGSRRKRGIPPKFRHQNLSVTSFPFHIMTGTEKSSPSNHSRQHNMLCRITEKVYEKNKKSSNINNNSNTKSTPKVIKTSQIERKINLRDSKVSFDCDPYSKKF